KLLVNLRFFVLIGQPLLDAVLIAPQRPPRAGKRNRQQEHRDQQDRRAVACVEIAFHHAPSNRIAIRRSASMRGTPSGRRQWAGDTRRPPCETPASGSRD